MYEPYNKVDDLPNSYSQKWMPAMCDARVYRKADIGSDLNLVRAEIKLNSKHKTKPKKPFTIEKLKDPATATTFALEQNNHFNLLREMADIEDFWSSLRDSITECAQNTNWEMLRMTEGTVDPKPNTEADR
uniref:Uncharacterized protein n=1 Tax=Sphaerodactylus townsendi TaxID=933632 RepID=A0ACB8EBT2_9SAUR